MVRCAGFVLSEEEILSRSLAALGMTYELGEAHGFISNMIRFQE